MMERQHKAWNKGLKFETDIKTTLRKMISNYHPNVRFVYQHSTLGRYLFMTQIAEHLQTVS